MAKKVKKAVKAPLSFVGILESRIIGRQGRLSESAKFVKNCSLALNFRQTSENLHCAAKLHCLSFVFVLSLLSEVSRTSAFQNTKNISITAVTRMSIATLFLGRSFGV